MKPFSQQEIDTLHALWRTHTHQQIAQLLGRTRRSVSVALWRRGLTGKHQPTKIVLSPEQIAWFRRNFPHVSNIVCATILGISIRSVIRFARRLGLAKTQQLMRDTQNHALAKARDSHLANGTFPPKGVVNANIAKGAPFRFKPGHAPAARHPQPHTP